MNGVTVGSATLRAEMTAISTVPTIQCYITAIDPVSFNPGQGAGTIATTGAAAWANLRIEGAAINQYVQRHFKYVPTSSQLAAAKLSLESELTQAALAKQYNCPGTAASALALMPKEMADNQILSQANSVYLISQLNATVPLTPASMKSYYASHSSNYDTICVSVALVPPTSVTAFNAAQAAGDTVSQLAAKFSVDPSRTKGGAYGCYPPTSSSYATVRADTATTALNVFAKTPQYISSNGSTFALFVTATKRTTTPYAQAQALVLTDLQALNTNSATTLRQNILYQAAVAVDPAFGRWGYGSTGWSTFVPALPSSSNVTSLTALTTATPVHYK